MIVEKIANEASIFLLKKLWRFAEEKKSKIVLYISMLLIANSIMLLGPVIFGIFIGEIQKNGLSLNNIWYLLFLLLAMFVGGYRHTPNVDAVLWLAKEIFPLVRLRNPHIRLHLVGSDTPDSVRDLGALPGIVVHGHVPDLTPLLDRTRINLAPLRYGAGVKGKINHSLAHGLPVVATTCAAEGMQLTHRVDAMVADSAADFAQSVLELYGDADLWQRLASAGLENTRQHFSPERARPVLAKMLGY